MKIYFNKSFVSAITYFFVMLISMSFSGCDDNAPESMKDKLIGTWHQASNTLDGVQKPLDSTRLVIQINSNHICVICDSTKVAVSDNKVVSRSGWSFNGELFNLAIDIPVSWEPKVDGNVLALKKIEFTQDGNFRTTIQTYNRIADIKFD